MTELVPLYRDPKSLMPVTQFNMKWVEPAGLVKFDFLGLKTLTVLDHAVKLVRRRGIDIDLTNLPLDDAKTYEMLARGETVGVFQVESQGMRRALVDMRPDRFEDLIVLVALYRPGPMANIPTYCARKLGHERTDYLHPKLEPILQATYGIITYQEQVQQIARDLAGYSLGKADILRRAMGKKDRKEMASQRDSFISGAVERGIGRADAEAIFDTCAKFAEYGFNKSHSAPYALLTYQTAYMKANYPVEFLAASMTLDMGNTDKLAEFRAEAERLGIKVEPPSINRSGVEFEVDGNTIYYALAALRGVGRQAVDSIVAARGDRPFADLADFGRRINPRAVNKRVLESLVAAGAFDAVEPNRARANAAVDALLATAQRTQDDAARGQSELFGGSAAPAPIMVGCARAVAAGGTAAARIRSGRLFPLRPSARRLCRGAQAASRAVVGRIRARRQRRRRGRPRRRHRGGAHRAAHQERQQDGHHRAVRSERPLRGGAVRRRLGAISRPVGAGNGGAAVPHRRGAGRRGARPHPVGRAARRGGGQNAARLARLPARRGADRRRRQAAASDAERRRAQRRRRRAASGGDGEVSMVLLLRNGSEVEVKLPGRFKVSPQIAGAIKAVTGVVTVEAL